MTDYLIRIIVAALLGGVIGLEREYRAKDAGFRTHFLVALGSALFMVLSQYGFGEVLSHYADNPNVRLDVSRVAAQIVTGIGFIGAGTIIFQKRTVHGLTTAAGVWVAAAIGMACGSSMYILACAATALVLLGMEGMNMLLHQFGESQFSVRLITFDQQHIEQVRQRLSQLQIGIKTYHMEQRTDVVTGHFVYVVSLDLHVRRNRLRQQMLDILSDIEGITIEVVE